MTSSRSLKAGASTFSAGCLLTASARRAFRGIFVSCFTDQTRSLLRRAGYGGLGLHGLIFGVAPPYTREMRRMEIYGFQLSSPT
ncbi:MAG: hypothetical protein OEW62_03305 [Candidatus Bathyarchaeota archaeon]|nr:hypothetical protein [Candidatus Bathyarchaeota archaeon]